MADVYEQNLASKSTLATTDYIRVVGSDNVSYKQLVSDVAKKIIENYTGSTLAGSAQSVKSAVDSLNSKSALTLNYTSNSYVTEASLNGCDARKVGNLLVLKFNSSLANFPSGSSVDNTQIGTISGWNGATAINVTISPQNGTTSNGILLLTVSNAGVVQISNRSGLPCNGFYRTVVVTSIS